VHHHHQDGFVFAPTWGFSSDTKHSHSVHKNAKIENSGKNGHILRAVRPPSEGEKVLGFFLVLHLFSGPKKKILELIK
jgi:hypothetical protein